MNAIEYLKKNHAKDTIISKGFTLAKFCTLKTTHKNSAIIPCNLLNIIYKGTKILHTKEGDIEVKAGEAFLITKGEYFMSEVVGDEEYMCLLIFFEQQLTKQLISELPFKINSKKTSNTSNLLKFKVDSFLQNSVDSLKLYLDDRPTFTEELLAIKLKELILLLLGSNTRQDIIRFFQNSILDKSDLKSFMENNYEKDLTIEEFARLSGRSLSAFKNEFKTIYKETPMKWILKKRLEKGKFLIQELGYEVGLAAHTVGFKTHAHFTRLYTKEFGINPSFIDK